MLTSVSIHLGATTAVPLTQACYCGLTLVTARADPRAHLPAVLDCIACGRLHPGHVTHRVARFADAIDAMTDPGPKLIFLP